MKLHSVLALALAFVAVPATAQATVPEANAPALSAAEIRAGATVFSAEGRRVGKVDRVRGDSVAVIRDQKMIYIPIATLTASKRGLDSTLSIKEINRL